MNKHTLIIAAVLATTTLSSCTSKERSDQWYEKRAQWYVQHPDKLMEEFNKCKKLPLEELAPSVHCGVIGLAYSKVFDNQANISSSNSK